jgi:2-polyprenyl-6-methoxyphenol hydroxylase-like FAD-dependent oxidoreductase
MFDVLRRVGLAVDESFGFDVSRRVCFGNSGAIVHELPVLRKMSAWSRFYRPLKDLFPADRYHFAMTLDLVEPHDDRVTAIFADGSRVDGDLVIGADGFLSAVRASIMPHVQPEYAHYIAWRGIVEESAMRRGHRRSNFVWYHAVGETELVQLCTDANGNRHGTAIPSHLIHKEEIARMERQARDLFAPQIAQLVEMAEHSSSRRSSTWSRLP